MKARYKKIGAICLAQSEMPEEELRKIFAKQFLPFIEKAIEIDKQPSYGLIKYDGILRIKTGG